MINENSLAAVEAANFSKKFCKPLYDTYNFSQIPHSILPLLEKGVEGGLPSDVFGGAEDTFDHVVLLFLDGFGWRFFEKFKEEIPLLKRWEEEGVISKLTSMFPSTTAAHVTCIHTGLTPSQSGLYEWFIYEPKLNEVIASLLFSPAGVHKIGELASTSLLPSELYPQETIYQQLNDRGVTSTVVQSESILRSPYSEWVLQGARTVGYKDVSEGLDLLFSSLSQKSYGYFYFSDIDTVGHRKGVDSAKYAETIHTLFAELETFWKKLPSRTALIVTADHGMVEVNPKTTTYINEKVENIEKYLLTNQKGYPLVPAGSCRDFFLHVQQERMGELKEVLEIFLEGIAEVYKTKDLIDVGFFGPGRPTENFLSRVGNLVILPYQNEAVWWHVKHKYEQNFYGAHGGLTREEMEIPFIFLPK